MQKFWIVVCNKSDLVANKRHASLQGARDEAERLARKHVGNTFLVFELIGSVAPYNPPVMWTEAEPVEREIRVPFEGAA